MHFTKLRVTGFKSFVEPTEVVIEPGMTGVVGPNGCGKSNVVEALRWAMGETSAKQMRGGEMDDVIFAGTAARPAYELADVTVQLRRVGGAWPHLGDHDELELTRRIGRGVGCGGVDGAVSVLGWCVQDVQLQRSVPDVGHIVPRAGRHQDHPIVLDLAIKREVVLGRTHLHSGTTGLDT